jgi:DNA polymerase-3 subunit alpha
MDVCNYLDPKFVHLHLHSEYSPQDAPVSLKKLVEYAKHVGHKALALTDHGTVSGWVKFAQLCKESGIKPIFGIEGYFTPDRHDRKSGRNNYHIVLLAKSNQGIRNIYALSEAAYRDGFYYDPRMDWELLEKYHEGIVCTSACVSGIVPETYREKGIEAAKEVAGRFSRIFGGDFYVELQHHNIQIERDTYSGMARLAADLGLKVVGTNDVHYLRKEDAGTQEALMALNMRKCIKDDGRLKHETNQLYLKSPEEMIELFGGKDRMAVQSTLEIADQCTAELSFGKAQLPSIEIPKEYSGDLEYLEHLARTGLRKLGKEGDPVYEARFKEEIDVLGRLREKGNQFDRYFLVVWDYVNWAWNNGIRVGIGRGSGAGSLLLYCLRVTGIDPLTYDLLFERFLDEERNEMPDIDIDFDHERGEEVYEYVRRRYGEDHCARIGTFQTFHVASAIKAAFRVFDPGNTWEHEQHEKDFAKAQQGRDKHKWSVRARRERILDETARMANEITKQLPKDPSGQPSAKCTLSKDAFDKKPDDLQYVYDMQEFSDLRKQYPEIMAFAEALEGLSKDRSVHAAGVLITKDPIINLCPQQYAGNGAKKKFATAFDMLDVERLGGVKFDFLRTKVLSVISRTVAMVRETRGVDVPIDTLEPSDPKVFKMFAKGDATAIFQFESPGMQKVLKQMKPDCFENLIAANALFRPGPMEHIDTFCKRKHGSEAVTYPVPCLEPILSPTFGIMVYQEQVIRMVRVLAGFTGSEADKVRKAMGKKKKDVLDAMREKFLKGCTKVGKCDEQTADKIWSDMEAFASYAFNRSHACAYAYTAYQTAYLKEYFPHEFWAAQLTVEGSDSKYDAVSLYEMAAKDTCRMLPLDINLSQPDYSIEGKSPKLSIRTGFKGIKGIGADAYVDIVAGRLTAGKATPYRNIFDFCMRGGNSTKSDIMRVLIDAGAFNCFIQNITARLGRVATRQDLDAEYNEQSGRAQKEKREKGARREEKQGIGLFFNMDDEPIDAAKAADDFRL